jgi:DtxR family transcriptional regulator, Mn-dependent transcriptional regulator
MLSISEENYLKAIFKILEKGHEEAGTNAIAMALNATAASATDMIKRLAEKKMVTYEKYRGVQLTAAGWQHATALIRKHRLWEVFLMEKLHFSWDAVHDMAEQLEHIQGNELVERLDAFLGFPRFDPHGDPIPDAEGRWNRRAQVLLSTLEPGTKAIVTGVSEHSSTFLQYLNQLQIGLGTAIEVVERFEFDRSLRLRVGEKYVIVSEKVGCGLLVQ